MATWHQLLNPVTLYHATMWTVVIDPPNECRGCVLFNSEKEAQTYIANLGKHHPNQANHSCILPPKKQYLESLGS